VRPPATFCPAVLCPWNETILHNFGPTGSADGSAPESDLTRDVAGNLYGTTNLGGGDCGGRGCGTVFMIDPQGQETVLHSFTGSPDGAYPSTAAVLLDNSGNIYGTTSSGGTYGNGTVFELSPSGSGWQENILYNFTGGADGLGPLAGVIQDAAGNLYGNTGEGGSYAGSCSFGCGVVFELSPTGSGWTETVLYTFTGAPDGASPVAKLLKDRAGNLYGTTSSGGSSSACSFEYPGGCGTVFELSPNGSGWTETILWTFTGGADGAIPFGPVVMDREGTLYGAAGVGGDLNAANPECFGQGCGTAFKLTR